MRLALIRHGPTEWNAAGRIQGRTDTPLSDAGRASLAGLRHPPGFAAARWIASPLRRAGETAALLGHPDAAPEPRLAEMSYGRYEGLTWAEVAERAGDGLGEATARGLDFRPPDGESPRMVQTRLLDLFAELAGGGGDVVAVCHKGVIRAVLSLAFDWPMQGKPPVRLDWRHAHVFELAPDGRPRPLAMNLPLGVA